MPILGPEGISLSLPQVSTAQIISGATLFIFLLFAIVITVFVAWIIYRILSHNIKVYVLDGNRRIIKDRAKIILEDGVKKVKLLKLKDRLKPIKREHFWLDGKSDALLLIKPMEGDLIPQALKVDNPNPDFITVSPDVRFWAQQERKSKFTKYMMKEKAWLKYLPIISMVVVITLISIIFIITLNKFEMVAGAINNFAEAVKSMPKVTIPPGPG